MSILQYKMKFFMCFKDILFVISITKLCTLNILLFGMF